MPLLVNDINSLQEIIDDSKEIFKFIVDNSDPLILNYELQIAYNDAWPSTLDALSEAKANLGNLTDAQRELAEKVGLSANQLAAKARGIFNSKTNWLRDRFNKNRIKDLLEWLSIVLGSLGSVLPGVELLQEFADGLRKAIEGN